MANPQSAQGPKRNSDSSHPSCIRDLWRHNSSDRKSLRFRSTSRALFLMPAILLAVFSLSTVVPVAARSQVAIAGILWGHFSCTFSSSSSFCTVNLTGYLWHLGGYAGSGGGPTAAGTCDSSFTGVVTLAAPDGDSITTSSIGTEHCLSRRHSPIYVSCIK